MIEHMPPTGGRTRAVTSGDCYRCHHPNLLYPATLKDGTKIGICYECREIIREKLRKGKSDV